MELTGKSTYLWPHECKPPHDITHPEKVIALSQAIRRDGWGKGEPALVGYQNDDDSIQLLSGSHRWEAARQVGVMLPVVLFPIDIIDYAFGKLETWEEIMQAGSKWTRA